MSKKNKTGMSVKKQKVQKMIEDIAIKKAVQKREQKKNK